MDKYPLRRTGPAPAQIEVLLNVPRQFREAYNQHSEGACVGHSQSWMMSILNRKLYDARRLYHEAQLIDEWDDTPPEDGTSLRAGFDVLRNKGHWRVYAGNTRPPELDEGISENRWLRRVDDARSAIGQGIPLNLGIWWYSQFDRPESKPRHGDRPDSTRREYYISDDSSEWGSRRGGHAITAVGASDAREAFALCNTWGTSYPFLVWLPYVAFERLMADDGECGLITDRV